MNNNELINNIISSLINNSNLSAKISADIFRDLYYKAKVKKQILWILIFMGEQVFAQPLGNKGIILTICEKKLHFYTEKDFTFLDVNDVAMYGSYKGPYLFIHFLKDILKVKRIVFSILMLAALFLITFFYIQPGLIKDISLTVIQAISIFITLFVVLVLSVNPEIHYRFAETDRFHKLTQSDKYIGYIGIGTLIIAIVSSLIAGANAGLYIGLKFQVFIKILQALLFSISLQGTLISFWLIVSYHMGRRHEMTEMLMAKTILEKQQNLYLSLTGGKNN